MTDQIVALGPEQLALLGTAFANGAVDVHRKYGALWGARFTTMKGLEAMGLLELQSYERDRASGDFVRRSAITDAGRDAFRRAAGAAAA